MHILDIIQHTVLANISHIGVWGYWIAAVATLFETVLIIGLFFPGSTIVLIFGALSAAGYYDFWCLMAFVVPFAIIGDYINYKLGKKYGNKWLTKEKWFLKQSYLAKGKKFFDSYGAKSLSIGRLIPGLKETFPFIAGSMDTKISKFLLWDTVGAIAWSFEFLGIGYLFGSSLNIAKAWLGRISIVLAFILFLFVFFQIFKILFTKYGKDIVHLQKSIWNSIKNNPDIQKIYSKHPKLFGFISSRLTTKTFYGLPLTLISFILLYLLFLFFEVALEIINKGVLYKFDLMLANLIYYFRNQTTVKFMLFITMFGNKITILTLIFTATIIFFINNKRKYILPLFISTIGSTVTTWLIKLLLQRPRPYEAYYHAVGFSFPSGHATIAMAFYGFLTYFAISEVKSIRSKLNFLFIGVIVILLIGASRIYLDVHYFSDVCAGYIVGAFWLTLASALSVYTKYSKPNTQKRTSKKMVHMSYFIVLLSLLFVTTVALKFNPKPIKPKPCKSRQINSIVNLFKNENMKYTTTILGRRQEPINLILIAKNNKSLKKSIRLAGWHFADKLSLTSIEKSINALIFNKAYQNAPISPDFWNYRVNNFGIEKLIKGYGIRLRHHGRIWKTCYRIDDKNIYVASVSFDTRLEWIIHKISPNIDKEREYFLKSLLSKHLVKKYKAIQLVKPFVGYNFYGDSFFTDGKAYVIWLK